MKVSDLLKNKGEKVITISPDETAFNAMKSLLEHKIGSLIVCDTKEKIIGIISERDILKATFENYDTLKTKKVAEIMTTNIIIAIPEDEIDYIMGIMTVNRVRHLPIVTDDGIVGIISIGDIVKCQLHETQVKNRYLEEFIFGKV